MKWPQLLFILLISNCVVGQSYWSFKERPIVPMPENVININDLLSTSTSTTKSNQKPLQKAPNAGACTDNIDFEWGNFTNWQCYTGLAYTSGGTNLVNWNAPGLPIAGRHQIISAATLPTNDAYGNFPRLCPNGGNFSIQLGNNSVGRQAEKVSCSITIPADQNNFLIEYYYAVVFQDPNHLLEQQPRFQTKVYDANNSSSIINCASYDFTAGSGLPGFKTSSVDNLVLYKPWTAVTINLSCYAGHTIILEFITEDCTKGVHFGYAYVDVSSNCTSLQSSATYCQNTQSLTLTAPSGYKSYNWYNSTFTQLLDTTQTITLTPPPANNTTFNVDLVPYSGFGCRDTAFTVLTVKPLPIASFAADSIICSGIPITFTNQSTISDITSLSALWDFGDGTSSTTTNSTKTYNTVGDYIVKLICTSIYGCSDTITKKIKVVNAPTTTTTNVSVCSNSLPYVWNGKSYNAAGTYTANFINSVGCDSVATLILSVKTPTTSTTNTSLCSNTLPFVWNGKSYNAAGIYTANFTNSVGCDSVVTLILAVKTPTTSTTNASVCSNTLPFVWNGKSCNAAGTYTANYSNSVGCDSIVTLVLSVKTPTTSTTNISVCSNNLPFVWNGINHNSAGTYTANFTNSVGCDSVATLVLAVKTPTTSTTNVSVCSNSLPYVWNGKSYNSAGTYTANFTNSVGCDSIATLVLAMKTPTTSTTNVSVCSNNLPYVWNGKSCNTEGTYTANFTNSVGCDSIATLVLAVKSPTTSTTNASVCSNNLPYIWSEKSYNIAGAYTASFINSVGCDSVATLVLAVKTPTNSTTTAFVCSNNLPFIWNGKNCNAAGTYTANFINSVGCDSVATLILAVKSPTTSTTNISVCSNTLPFIWNGKSYNSAGTYTASFLNSVGCDSVATLILAVKSPTTSTTNASVCSNNLPFVWNGKNYNSAGTYTANFINSVGCDSIATLVLAVKMPTTSTTNASVCSNNLPFVWNGKSYNSAGTYIANFINSVGCDSVATLVLAVKSPTTSTTTASVCSNNLPFIWNGKSYNSVGTYTASFINSVGCDSIATLVLTVKIPTTSTTNASVCFNTLPYVWNGKNYNIAGTYTASFTNSVGCDSIATLVLAVKTPTTSTINVSVCSNNLPFVWNGKSYNAAGTYTASFINSVGCDSIATLVLAVKMPSTSTNNISICSNILPFVWNGISYNAAGTYTANFSNFVGCDSVATLVLAVKSTSTSTSNISICSNNLPYVWNGKSCNAAGTYTANYSNSVGCDSIVTLVLSVKTPTTSTTNVSVCSNNLPYVWNGKSCNAAGTYTANFTNSVGCDSVATLVLAVKTPTTSTTTASVCSNNLPYVWNGKSCNTAGTYTANFTNSVGCDSVANLVLAVKSLSTSFTTASVCSNNLPFVWNGKSYNSAGTYTANFTNSVGCDSVATLILAVKTPSISTTNASECSNNLPFIWNGKSYNSAGTYIANFTNSVGCDSVATLVLAVKTPTTSTTNVSVCSNSLPYVWNGKSYNSAGTYTANFTNSVGCDSVATLILAVKTPTTSTTTAFVCSNNLPFVWNGKGYNSAGTYTANLTNSAGCDSIATLVLAVKMPSTSTTNISVCSNNLQYVWNGKSYNSAGTYTANFTNFVGCDSVATLILAVKTPTTSTTTAFVCSNNLPFIWNGKSYNSAGTYTANFINSVGCDSIATFVFAVKSPSTSTTNVSVCSNNLPFVWNGKSYNTAGTYTASFTNSVGCDSIATLVLAVKSPTTSTTNVSVCSNNLPYVWNGKSYNTPGTFTANFSNFVGCDSVATLVLAVKSPSTSITNVSVCSNNLPYVWNGKNYNIAGTYTASFTNSVGCDSIATLVLAVKTPTTSTTNVFVCSNTLPYVWNGKSYNSAGTYTANFTNSVGCDSIATFVLAVKIPTTSTTNVSVCSNNLPYVWNGKSYNSAGTYTANLTNSAGCDSIATLVLAVKMPSTSTTNISVCSNNLPYVWTGKSYNAAGTYTTNFTNSVGCDSVATLILAVKTPTTSTTNVSVCSNILSFVWNGKSYNYAGVYTANFTNSVGCDSIATLILAVKSTSNSTTNISICSNNLPYVWNGKSYNSAGTYTASFLNSVGCDSIATLVLSVKTPTTSTISTDVCSSLLPFIWNGKSFNAAGTYTANLINAAGCDSVATLILAVKQSTASVIHVVTCPYTLPYFWNNHSYTTTGVYNVCLVNSIGCDSIATLDFIVKSPLTSTTVDYVCPSALPYFWNKNFYSETGTYTAFFHTVSGCDSVATLKLNVVSTSSSVTKDAVNAAKLPYVWNKMAYTESGTYTSPISFINAVGCDSIATLILKVNLSAAASTIVSVCPSDLPYIWNGTAYYAAGTYTKIMTNVFGDNVVVTLELNLLPVYNISQSISIFTGQIYTINGNNYDQPGEYTDILKTKNGCDSTVITNLSFIKIPNTITPNGDGKNDVFMKDYHVKIYNRNGIKLFDGIDGWDGTYNGKPVAKDTYFYVLIYLSGDIEKSEEGYIMVIR